MIPGCCEWNENLLRECMFGHDVCEVLKLRLSDREQDDQIPWFYEWSGIFTIRSAYKLAVESEQEFKNWASNSTRSDGSRLLYGEIWSANAPSKVQIFAWRLAQDGLATQANRMKRRMEKVATCQICGREDESGHHAVIRCTKAAALRREMRKVWRLQDEEQFYATGPEWLQLLLSHLDDETKANNLLLLWQVWFLRNNNMHGDGWASVTSSIEFLRSYATSLYTVRQVPKRRAK
jgi:hypothetical protein